MDATKVRIIHFWVLPKGQNLAKSRKKLKKKMFVAGFEPRSTRWQADMLTPRPQWKL